MSPERAIGLILAALLGALALGAGPASAQEDGDDQEGRMRFQLAQRYYDQGRFAEAAVEFEAAYRASGRDALLYNMYISYRDAGDVPHATDALRRYLATDHPDEDTRRQLQLRLDSYEQQVADGGAEGGDAPPPPARASGGGSALPLVGGVLAGAGAALVIGAVITGVLALEGEVRLAEACPGDRCPADQQGLIEETETLGVVTDVLWVSGAVLVAGGVALLVVGLLGDGDDATAVRPNGGCGPDGCFGGVEGRF